MIENVMALKKKAREETPENWLASVQEIKEIAVSARQEQLQRRFEKLPRLDLRKIEEGTTEDPTVILVQALNNYHMVKTSRMEKPMGVLDVLILNSSDPNVKKGEKYTIWANTSVLASELDAFQKQCNGDTTNEQFIIAYYGRVASKKFKGVKAYLYRVIPYTKH